MIRFRLPPSRVAEFSKDATSARFVEWNWLPAALMIAVGLLFIAAAAAKAERGVFSDPVWPITAFGGLSVAAGLMVLGSPTACRFDAQARTYRYACWYGFIPVRGAGPLSEIDRVLVATRENPTRRRGPTWSKAVLVVVRGRVLTLLRTTTYQKNTSAERLNETFAGGLSLEDVGERLAALIGCPAEAVEGFGYSLKNPPV